jgi:hypothetical protein
MASLATSNEVVLEKKLKKMSANQRLGRASLLKSNNNS